jgi:hypothetical protein
MTCNAVQVTLYHVLSGTSAAVTDPAPGIWDLNTKLVLSEHHPRIWKSKAPSYTKACTQGSVTAVSGGP